MKRDLKSFLKDFGSSPQACNNDMPSVENIQQVMDKYSTKSQDELLDELKKNIEIQKNNGTYSPEALQRFAAMAAPMLSQEQQIKMQQVLKMLN